MNWAITTDSLLILNDLIRAHGETSACYRRAATRAQTPGERVRLAGAAEQRRGFAKQLLDRAARLGGHFAVRTSLAHVASQTDEEGERNPLAEAERIESRMRAKYEEALAEPVDAETHRLLKSQYEAVATRSAA